ncbi:helix-turn-helix transcriptional regulator [Paenibacillus piri]|uniref:Transcriptional regulator n=1 Tax=Paenibacillus piri TaxID=2547395 RepID=A0A4R5KB85_9BACL|nr:helix-turn-helix transcriptional regulator [Paenibacillus piri]TDF91240.1 transcriptional regulator [Paenibacillus piri]
MTLIDVERLHTLADFLKASRTSLPPDAAGLPGGRRTPGLRREEVAQLAGVSTIWYTWLEEGKEIHVPPQALNRIAAALQLNTEGRSYLFTLASRQTSSLFSETPAVIDPTLQRILDYLNPCPAFIADRRCDIIGWNKAAGTMFGTIGTFSREERNMVWLAFMKKEIRDMVVNWEDFANDFLTILRNYETQYRGDPWYGEFIEHCGQMNPLFRRLWHNSELPAEPRTQRELNHPRAGNMKFELTSFQVYARADLRCCVYTPMPGTPTEARMERLLAGY